MAIEYDRDLHHPEMYTLPLLVSLHRKKGRWRTAIMIIDHSREAPLKFAHPTSTNCMHPLPSMNPYSKLRKITSSNLSDISAILSSYLTHFQIATRSNTRSRSLAKASSTGRASPHTLFLAYFFICPRLCHHFLLSTKCNPDSIAPCSRCCWSPTSYGSLHSSMVLGGVPVVCPLLKLHHHSSSNTSNHCSRHPRTGLWQILAELKPKVQTLFLWKSFCILR
jgi:hypothetical protein